MRNSCDSSMYWCSSAASAIAEVRSWPNGFSTTTRACVVQALHDASEEERRDLQVEHRPLEGRDGVAHLRVRRGVAEVAGDVGEPGGEPGEDRLVELLAGADDRLARALHELIDAPVVDCHADDGAVEQVARLEAVQGAERHDLGEVAGDPEDHEDIAARGVAGRGHGAAPLVARWELMDRRQRMRSTTCSPTRIAFAMAVSAGFTAPMLGKKLVSTT
jgi:hypothetical protein